MREKLKKIGSDKRHTFVAIFERYGSKRGRYSSVGTILLKDIRFSGSDNILTDHIWLTVGKQLYELGDLKRGDTLQFNARIKEYYHKYFDRDYMIKPEYSLDYRLDRANKFSVLNREVERKIMSKDNSATERQLKLISAIEETLNLKFTGLTKQEASKFISDNIAAFKAAKPSGGSTQKSSR